MLNGITSSMDMSLSKLREMVKEEILACCSPWGRQKSDTTEQQRHSACRSGGQAQAGSGEESAK